MKKTTRMLLSIVLVLAFATSSFAITISYTNSGSLIGVYVGNDDVANVSSKLGYDVLLFNKIDIDSYSQTSYSNSFMTLTSSDGWYSGTWETNPNYIDLYSVKAGNYFALYSVNPVSATGTWSTEDIFVGQGNNPEISHFSAFNPTQKVPEPTTLLLFGAGIAGLALYRRKRS